jgi:septum formation protein
MKNEIILASSSVYRQQLLQRLGLPFTSTKPLIDEDQLKQKFAQMPAVDLAENISYEKGYAVFEKNKKALVISGDQLVSIRSEVLGKPGGFEQALTQLKMLNNRTHHLVTSITLFWDDQVVKYNHITTLKMKNLSEDEMTRYLQKEQPYDCAGSYKIEKNGITLFESIECDDFTAIQGIPMIWLSNRLKEMGYEFFRQ